MALRLTVPTLADSGEAQTLTEAIKTVDPTAKVEVDVKAKTVTVDSASPDQPVASEESIKQAITATGHSLKE